MSIRLLIVFFLSLLSVFQADAKNKKKQAVPDDVLEAQTALLVISADTRAPLTNETDVQAIRDDLEKAFTKWDRFRIVHSPTADLVIVAHQGHVEAPEILAPPLEDRSVFHLNNGNPTLDPNSPGAPTPRGSAQRTANELRLEEDTFEVYRGGVDHPLDASPVWQYRAKLALHGPKVAAVEHFRKAIDESEKQRQQKP
jgi:hypothetical protein